MLKTRAYANMNHQPTLQVVIRLQALSAQLDDESSCTLSSRHPYGLLVVVVLHSTQDVRGVHPINLEVDALH